MHEQNKTIRQQSVDLANIMRKNRWLLIWCYRGRGTVLGSTRTSHETGSVLPKTRIVCTCDVWCATCVMPVYGVSVVLLMFWCSWLYIPYQFARGFHQSSMYSCVPVITLSVLWLSVCVYFSDAYHASHHACVCVCVLSFAALYVCMGVHTMYLANHVMSWVHTKIMVTCG